MGVDPLADKMPGWNPYNYTLNNPINMIDPDGRLPIVPIIMALIGGGFEYGSQVRNNYKSDYDGYEAWVGEVDFSDVVIETGSSSVGMNFYGDVAVEGLKASLDINGNGEISYVGDGSEKMEVSNVLKTTAKNSLISIVSKKASNKVADNYTKSAVQKAKKEVHFAQKSFYKAKKKAGNNYSRSNNVYNADLRLSGARQSYQIKSELYELGVSSQVGRGVSEKLTTSQVSNITDFIQGLGNGNND